MPIFFTYRYSNFELFMNLEMVNLYKILNVRDAYERRNKRNMEVD